MPCKEPVRTLENTPMLYRPCTASFDAGSRKTGRLSILRTNRRDVLESYWQDETDWLCTVEFLPTDDQISQHKRVFSVPIELAEGNEQCSIRKSKRVDQGGESGRLIPTAWIVKKIAGEGWTPVPQDLDQAPLCDHLR